MSPSQPTLSQVDIVRQAEELAARLTPRGEEAVKRNVLHSLTADFLHRRDPERLRRTLELLLTGSGGHIRRGGKSYGDQVRLAARELSKELDRQDLSPEALCSLIGWTARLLSSGDGPGEAGGDKEKRHAPSLGPGPAGGGKPTRRKPLPGDEKPRPQKLHGKGLPIFDRNDALAALRDQLRGREENGKP